MRIAITTLGCKINQYESDALRQQFVSNGDTIVPFEDDADVFIINTCTVTAKSDYQCRQVIRSAVRRAGGGRVIVTGCYAETQPEAIKNIPGVDLVVSNKQKTSLIQQLSWTGERKPDTACLSQTANLPAQSVRGRTRGFLKIQTGCDNRCTYCIVPAARGNSQSALPHDVIAEFDRMVAVECPEIVLTGIHIGAYGRDLPLPGSISQITNTLLKRRGASRLRISSIEPREIDDELIGLIGSGLCRHVHIPLQSGDDRILAEMHRDYDSGFYRSLVTRISKSVPDIAIGADIIVGFPGEDDTAFENTMRLVEELPLTHLHVFSYSARPGTPAATMKQQVPEPVKKRRSEALRALGRDKNLAFRKGLADKAVEAVIEDKVDAASGLMTGLTDNYVKVLVKNGTSEMVGRIMQVRIIETTEQTTIAEIENTGPHDR